MQYKTEFIKDPPQVHIFVDGDVEIPTVSGVVDVTEITTEADVHVKGTALVAEMEAKRAAKESEKLTNASRIANLESLKVSIGSAKEVSASEIEEYKAKVEAERIAAKKIVEPV